LGQARKEQAAQLRLIAIARPVDSSLLIAVAVRVSSRGPALFRQERVGQDGFAVVRGKGAY
jgi:lipopolysaccharide/colanic/teichoic acid biosynthesis glycosyltransferase